jgi:DNA-binding transcriptional LysR family regulator
MDRNQLDGLLALRLVAERRNFTAAAAELGISPPAISKLVKQLEKRLGVTLLTRTTRSTSPTEAGERFLSQAGPALEQILAAMKDVGSLGRKPGGRLRLNVPTLIYPGYLKKVVSSFSRKYPDVSVELHFENAATDVFERGFDAGIRVSDILAKDMIAIKLFGPLRFVVAGAPKYFNRAGRPKHPKDLLTHNCIRIGTGNRLYDRWEFESKGKAFEVQVKGSLIMNDSMLALDEAVDGGGLIYATEDAITDKIDSGKLEIVLKQFAPSSTGYYLYYPQRSQVQPKLRAFIEHLKALQTRP